MKFYGINYAEFSLLPAMYYIGYAFMQIPAGIFFTKFKENITISSLMVVVGIGTLMLYYSPNFVVACIASLIIGIGSPVGVLGASSVIRSRFNEHLYAFIFGLTLSFGLIAATYTSKIIDTGLEYFSWQQLYIIATIIVIFYAITAFIIVHDKKSTVHIMPDISKDSVISLVKKTICTKNIVIMAIFSGFLTTPMQGFADVWGINFLMLKFFLTKKEAIYCNSFIFLGMGVSSPIIGMLAQKYHKLFSGIIACGLLMLVSFVAILLPIPLDKVSLSFLLLLVGIGCSFPTLSFTLIIEHTDAKISNIAISFTNMVLLLSGFVFHPIIGYSYNSLMRFTEKLTAYTFAMSLIPIGIGIGILGLLYFARFDPKNKL